MKCILHKITSFMMFLNDFCDIVIRTGLIGSIYHSIVKRIEKYEYIFQYVKSDLKKR